MAAEAADSKKAINLRVLDLREVTSFTDYFVICSGGNSRQVQAIANEIQQKLSAAGERPTNVEGLETAEWVLLDYGDLVVHVFSEAARAYYDLDRLWRTAQDVAVAGITSAAPMTA